MKPVRIVERTLTNGHVVYVIQQKHWLYRWAWVDACDNGPNAPPWISCRAYTLEDAKKQLYRFDGTKEKNKVVYEANIS